jgi:hypothetical protein
VNNALRELGGVFGVAILAAVFAAGGGYRSPATFVDGLGAALWIGAVAVGVGAAVALLIPSRGSRPIPDMTSSVAPVSSTASGGTR